MSGASDMLDAALDIEPAVEPAVLPPGGGSGDDGPMPAEVCVASLPPRAGSIRDTGHACVRGPVNHHAL